MPKRKKRQFFKEITKEIKKHYWIKKEKEKTI